MLTCSTYTNGSKAVKLSFVNECLFVVGALKRETGTMRILQIIDHLGLGGVQVWLRDLNAHWPQAADEREVISLGKKISLAAQFEQQTGSLLECWQAAAWDPSVLAKLWRRVRRRRYDIIHVHLQKATWAGWFATAGHPASLLIHIRSSDFIRHLPWLRIASRLSRPQTVGIIAVSTEIAQAVRASRIVPEHRLWTLLNGVSLRRMSSGEGVLQAARLLRQQLNIPATAFVVLYAGRLSPEKGVTYLLQALRQVDQPLVALIVGNGPLRSTLEQEAARLGIADRVRFVGLQTEMATWLHASDAFVLPSLLEGLPVSLLEAGALAKPIVATAVGGVPELIRHGQTGLLVPPGDVPALTQAIQRLHASAELRQQLGQAAQQHVTQFHSMDAVARQVREIYQLLCSPSPK